MLHVFRACFVSSLVCASISQSILPQISRVHIGSDSSSDSEICRDKRVWFLTQVALRHLCVIGRCQLHGFHLSRSKSWSSVCCVITEGEPGSEQHVGKSLSYALGSVPFGVVSVECNPGSEQVSSFGFPQLELL